VPRYSERRRRTRATPQAQLRHADPTVTLRHYQKSVPASVRAAAMALEEELIGRSASRSERVRLCRCPASYWKNWSHPPGSNRRPADYEKYAPAPTAPLALYGSACYQQLGEAAFAQIATSDGPNRWGFGTVSAQVEFDELANRLGTHSSNAPRV
jgi:hypothetical protein